MLIKADALTTTPRNAPQTDHRWPLLSRRCHGLAPVHWDSAPAHCTVYPGCSPYPRYPKGPLQNTSVIRYTRYTVAGVVIIPEVSIHLHNTRNFIMGYLLHPGLFVYTRYNASRLSCYLTPSVFISRIPSTRYLISRYVSNNINNDLTEMRNSRFFSPRCAVSCRQHARSNGQGATVCKSRATHRALITCNMLCSTWYEGTAQLLSLTECESYSF